MSQSFTVGNITYESLPACSVGDYGGAGTIGRANIDSLLKELCWIQVDSDVLLEYDGFYKDREFQKIRDEHYPPAVLASGGYGYEELFLRKDYPDFDALYDRLESYPVYDGSQYERQEMEDKETSWECWMESDFKDHVRKYVFGDDDDAYDKWEEEYSEQKIGMWTIESFLNDNGIYIEEDGYQSYTLSWDRLKRVLEDTTPDEMFELIAS